MRVVVTALRGEVVAELRPLMIAHPGVVVGLAAPVQCPDAADPRRDRRGEGRRDLRLAAGFRHGTDPIVSLATWI